MTDKITSELPEVERDVIGYALKDSLKGKDEGYMDVWAVVLDKLTADAFTDVACRDIYQTARELRDAPESSLRMGNISRFSKQSNLTLSNLADRDTVPALERTFNDAIKDLLEMEKIRKVDARLTQPHGDDPAQWLQEMAQMIAESEAAIDSVGQCPKSIGWDLTKANYIDSRFGENDQSPIPTFSRQLNKNFNGGLANGKVYTIVAMAGGGKTTLALQIAQDIAEAGTAIAVFVAMEMSTFELLDKTFARYGKFDSGKIEEREGNVSDEIEKRYFDDNFDKDFKKMASNFYVLEGDTSWTVATIRQKVKAIERDRTVDGKAPRIALFVDPFHRLKESDKRINGDQIARVGKIIADLKNLARTESWPVVLLSDTTKAAAEKQERNERIGQGGIAYSYYAVHTTDVLLEIATGREVLNKHHYFKDKPYYDVEDSGLISPTQALISFTKNRSGRKSEVAFMYDRACHVFLEDDGAKPYYEDED